MIDKFYRWLLRLTSKPEERGWPSAGYWQAKIRRKAIDICSSYTGSILEVGCGEGLFLAGLKRVNANVELWGADPWREIIMRAGQLFARQGIEGINLSAIEGGRLPFEDNSFDGVVCINVFYNLGGLKEVEALVNEISRVCKDGGRVVVEFRNSLSPVVAIKFKLAKYYDSSVRVTKLPLNTYKKSDIAEVLKCAGLKVLREFYLDFPIHAFSPIIILEAEKHA